MKIDIDEIRQSPRSFVDLETVIGLSDRVMGLEAEVVCEEKRFNDASDQMASLAAKVAELEALLEAEPFRGEREQALTAQNGLLREALELVIDDLLLRANLNDEEDLNVGQGVLDKANEALTLPNDSDAWLRKRDAETLRKAAKTLPHLPYLNNMYEWLMGAAKELERRPAELEGGGERRKPTASTVLSG